MCSFPPLSFLSLLFPLFLFSFFFIICSFSNELLLTTIRFEGSPETSTSVLDHALPKAFLITFAHLSTMAKLALLRGIVFIKGAHAANILFGKLPKKENYNLVTDYVFARAVQMTLNGGEQHSMIMGLQCVHGLLQRLMAVITDPTIFSPGKERKEREEGNINSHSY